MLHLISLLAPNADGFYRDLAAYLAQQHRLCITALNRPPWRERERRFDSGAPALTFLCGAAYVRRVDGGASDLTLLAAPVARAERYGGRPVYFSDVVVRADARARQFADLRGAAWAFNEPLSFSGHAIVRAHLARLGLDGDFFGSVRASGSHQESLRLVLEGQADAAAIDSLVLECELRRHPALAERLRTLQALGPHASPPAVARGVAPEVALALRDALLRMHEHPAGRLLLARGGLARFAPVSDQDYEPLRQTMRHAEQVALDASLARAA